MNRPLLLLKSEISEPNLTSIIDARYNRGMKHLNSNTYLVMASFFVLLSGCMPAHLAKYRKHSSNDSGSAAQISEPVTASDRAPRSSRANQATIYAVNKQTFRFLVKDDQVWNAALDVLMRNYNITIVDRRSGVITTEWDSFYLDSKV